MVVRLPLIGSPSEGSKPADGTGLSITIGSVTDSVGGWVGRSLAGQRTIVLFGDSRTANATGISASTAKYLAFDWFGWGQAHVPGGPVFQVIANAGIGGNTTAQMKARIQTDVFALNPHAMTIWGGTNDAWVTAADVDASVANMTSMIGDARARGIHVFLISETVCNTKTTSFNLLVMRYNDLLREFALATPGVEYWDFNSQIIDPLNASLNTVANVTYDGLHLSATGAYLCGKNIVAPALAKWPCLGVSLVQHIKDNRANSTNSRNLLSGGMFQGSGGSLGTGHTGTAPTKVTTSGTCTATVSTVSRSDGFGNNLHAVVSATSSSDTFNAAIALDVAPTAGATYVIEGEMTVSSATNLNRCEINTSFLSSGVSMAAAVLGQGNATQIFPGAFGPVILRSPPFVAPANRTGELFNVLLAFSGAGGATVDAGRVSLRQIA